MTVGAVPKGFMENLGLYTVSGNDCVSGNKNINMVLLSFLMVLFWKFHYKIVESYLRCWHILYSHEGTSNRKRVPKLVVHLKYIQH